MSVQQMLHSVQVGEGYGAPQPEPEPEHDSGSRGGSAGSAISRRMRRVSVALLGGDDDDGIQPPSHRVSADDDKRNLEALMGVSTAGSTNPEPKKKASRMRRLSLNLMAKLAPKTRALPDSLPSPSGLGPVGDPEFGHARARSAGTSRAGSAHSADSGGTQDDVNSPENDSNECQPKTQRRGGGFGRRMRRLSVEALGRVAKAAGEQVLEDTEEHNSQNHEEQRAVQQLAEQNDRRMRAEMRRTKEANEQAKLDAHAAELEAERKRIAEETARKLQKEREDQEHIRLQVERQQREKEQQELRIRSMGRMTKTRETAMELYTQALEQGVQSLESEKQRRPSSAASVRGPRPNSATSVGGASSVRSVLGGHWTVEAPAAVTCEMSDALDEVKLMAHKIAPVKYGGVTRDRLVIIAIGGPSCSGKSWLGLKLADSAHQGGLEALLLSLDTFTKVATGAVQSPPTVPLHPFLDASSLMPPDRGSASLDNLATYDLAFARRCMKQLRRDLATELPARAVSSGQGEGGTGITTARVPPSRVVVIEGRFALHPMLADVVDLRVHCGGSPHLTLLRSVARHTERKLMQERRADIGEECPTLVALQQLAASTLPMAALYSSRIGSCADLLIRNDWSPLGTVSQISGPAHKDTDTVGINVDDLGGHTIYGVTVNRGNSSADFNRIAKWIYGIVRTASGRCVSLDGPTHLLDYEWLVNPVAAAGAPRRFRRSVAAAAAAAVHASVNTRNICTATESMRGGSRGGVSVPSRETHSSATSRSSAMRKPAAAARAVPGNLPMSAKAEERARQRSRKRTDPNGRPWRTAAQPRVASELGSDESDDDTMTSASTNVHSRVANKKPLPPWPEDGTLPPVANVVEAIGMPPHDALDASSGGRIGVDGQPRHWVRISDRAGQYRVVVCERPKDKHNIFVHSVETKQQRQQQQDQRSSADPEANTEGAAVNDDERHQGAAKQQGKVSSPSKRRSKHRRSDNDNGKRRHRRRNGKSTSDYISSGRSDKKGGSSPSLHANQDTNTQEQNTIEQDREGTTNADDNDEGKERSGSMDRGGTGAKCEQPSASRRFKLPCADNAVPVGVAAWNELALGGETEGGNVLSKLLAIGYSIDTVQTVQSHSFLFPCFASGADPSADLGVHKTVHAAGGSVLVVVERRTLLGGLRSIPTQASVANDDNAEKEEQTHEGERSTVAVRIEGTNPFEVERVGRLITLGTLAAKKLRGVDAENVSALTGFVSTRPTTASSATLPWLNPWRDNDTPANSRPTSCASNRSQQAEHGQSSSRPGSGSSVDSCTRKRSTGGGYGAGGLVALPVNRSTDINRSQRRVRSREGRPSGGKHGEYWKTDNNHKPQGQGEKYANSVPSSRSSGDRSGSGMASVATAQERLRMATQESSSDDEYDA